MTGGASGIGLATAQLLANRGAEVYAFDLQSHPSGSGINFVTGDVAQPEAVQSAVRDILKKRGRIDLLILNAGIHTSGNIEETPTETIENLISVNFLGAIHFLKEVLPQMRSQRQGCIVINASDQAFVAKKENAIYGATKAALAHLAKSTALDYADFGIRVNAVCPGTIDTPFYRKAIRLSAEKKKMSVEFLHETLSKAQPLNRIGQPEEVAQVIAFLCSEASSFMTGALVPVDGGYLAV